MYRGKFSTSTNWKCQWSQSVLPGMRHLRDHLQSSSPSFSGVSSGSSVLHCLQPGDPDPCDCWGLIITVLALIVRICFFTQWSSSAFDWNFSRHLSFGDPRLEARKLREKALLSSCETSNAVTFYKLLSKGKYLLWFRASLKIIKRMLMFNILKYWIFKLQYFYLGFDANISKEQRLLIATDYLFTEV